MPAKDLKKESIAWTENTNAEELLSLLKEDFVFFRKVKGADNTDNLSDEQLKERKA